MPRKKASPEKEAEPSFEEAISELEDIVAAMEEEELPLEELVSRFEQGTRLLGRCQSVLDSAKKRLQTIATKPETGKSAANTLNTNESEDTDSTDPDDIRLF